MNKIPLFVGFSWLCLNTYKKNQYSKSLLNEKKNKQYRFRGKS